MGPQYQGLTRVSRGAHSFIIEERQMGRSLGIQIYAHFKIGNCPECPQFKIRHAPPVPAPAAPDWLTWFEGMKQKMLTWDGSCFASSKSISKNLGLCLKEDRARCPWKRNGRKVQVSTNRKEGKQIVPVPVLAPTGKDYSVC